MGLERGDVTPFTRASSNAVHQRDQKQSKWGGMNVWARYGMLAHHKKQISKTVCNVDYLWKQVKGKNPIINDHSVAKPHWYQMSQEGISMKTESRWPFLFYLYIILRFCVYLYGLEPWQWTRSSDGGLCFPWCLASSCATLLFWNGAREQKYVWLRWWDICSCRFFSPWPDRLQTINKYKEWSTKMENSWVFKSLGGKTPAVTGHATLDWWTQLEISRSSHAR